MTEDSINLDTAEEDYDLALEYRQATSEYVDACSFSAELEQALMDAQDACDVALAEKQAASNAVDRAFEAIKARR